MKRPLKKGDKVVPLSKFTTSDWDLPNGTKETPPYFIVRKAAMISFTGEQVVVFEHESADAEPHWFAGCVELYKGERKSITNKVNFRPALNKKKVLYAI